ncbi:MAG TPA: flavin reductase family protein, partial [Burkholderiaceae bacterium]|nr:flavin reductase family protein [Burkholderiaceae bacterium]
MLVPEIAASELVPDELRRALGRFVTGVTIVTCRDEQGVRIGLTANSFNALSLDPPLVLWSLRESSSTIGAFTGDSHFAINVL